MPVPDLPAGGWGYALFVNVLMAMRNFVVARISVSVPRRSVMIRLSEAARSRRRCGSWRGDRFAGLNWFIGVVLCVLGYVESVVVFSNVCVALAHWHLEGASVRMPC
jgi:hypothetical protein